MTSFLFSPEASQAEIYSRRSCHKGKKEVTNDMRCDEEGYSCVNLYCGTDDCESYYRGSHEALTSSDSSPTVQGPLSPSSSVTAEPWSSSRLSTEYLYVASLK